VIIDKNLSDVLSALAGYKKLYSLTLFIIACIVVEITTRIFITNYKACFFLATTELMQYMHVHVIDYIHTWLNYLIWQILI